METRSQRLLKKLKNKNAVATGDEDESADAQREAARRMAESIFGPDGGGGDVEPDADDAHSRSRRFQNE